MGENNDFFLNFERNKYLKKLPSMQRVKQPCVSYYIKSTRATSGEVLTSHSCGSLRLARDFAACYK